LDTGGVKNSKLFEALATSFWNLAAGVETPEMGQRSEPIGLFTNPSSLGVKLEAFGANTGAQAMIADISRYNPKA
jgi:hypothetical protein